MGKNAPGVKLVSWNVCGLRSVLKKGFLSFVEEERPDVICLQETRCPSEIWEPLWLLDYHPFFNVADKKGYSGTATFTKVRPHGVALGIDLEEHGREGRTLTTEFDRFHLVNVYVPNARRELTRLDYRQQWDRDFLAYVRRLEVTQTRGVLRRSKRGAPGHRSSRGPKANLGQRGLHRRGTRGASITIWLPDFWTLSESLKTGGRALYVVEQYARCPRKERGLAHRLFSPLRRAASAAAFSVHPLRRSGAATTALWASNWTFERRRNTRNGHITAGYCRKKVCSPGLRIRRGR